MKKYQELLKNILLFIIASFIPKTLAFFMVPLYTRYLSTTDYGTADLLSNTVTLLMPVLTLQIQDAVMKYTIQNKYSRKDIFSVGTIIVFVGGSILVIGCLGINFTKAFYIERTFLVFLCINYFTGSLNNIFSYFCRGINKVKIITIGSIANSVVTIICNLLFLVICGWGLTGYLIANSLGNIIQVIILCCGADLISYFHIKIESIEMLHQMIKLSIPMIFSALSWWVNNAADKYILTYFCGVSIVGIYAVSSKIPTILSTFGDVIAKSFAISAIKEIDIEDTDGFLGKSYSIISLGMTIICSIIMIMNIWLAHFLFSKNFYEAWKMVPPLLLSVSFNQLSWTCENILLAVGKTKVLSWTAVLGAGINVALNIIIIPFWGAYGAAVTTVIGFCCTWVARYWILNKHVKLKHNFGKELVSYILLILQVCIAYYGNDYILIQGILLAIIISIYYKEIITIGGKIIKKNGFL